MKTCCGYSLEAFCWGASYEYPQHMFSSRNKKNITAFWLWTVWNIFMKLHTCTTGKFDKMMYQDRQLLSSWFCTWQNYMQCGTLYQMVSCLYSITVQQKLHNFVWLQLTEDGESIQNFLTKTNSKANAGKMLERIFSTHLKHLENTNSGILSEAWGLIYRSR